MPWNENVMRFPVGKLSYFNTLMWAEGGGLQTSQQKLHGPNCQNQPRTWTKIVARMLQATKKIHLYDNIQLFPSGALPWQVQVSPHFTIPCTLSPIFLSFSFLLFCPHLLLYSLLNILSLPLLQHSPFIFSNLANWRSSSGAVPSAKGVQLCSSK